MESTKPISSATSTAPVVTIPPRTGTASSTLAVPAECTSSISVFERDDCITKKAVTSKNTQLCTLVSGSLSQSACLRDVGGSTVLTIPAQSQSYDAFLRSTSSVLPTTIQNTVVSTPGILNRPTISTSTDSRFTVEGLTQRFKDAPLALFNVSPYQVRPGDTVTLQGTGFGDVNDVHANGYLVSRPSTDGFTLSFPAPPSPGDYDVWVTNAKGSSQVVGRTMRLTVTTNPAPLPVVTVVSPNPANYSDTITITGTGFSNTNTVSTSLGIIENVASSGGAISLRLSDFSLASKIKEIPYMRGRKAAILLYVQSEGGLSKEPYSFDVQF